MSELNRTTRRERIDAAARAFAALCTPEEVAYALSIMADSCHTAAAELASAWQDASAGQLWSRLGVRLAHLSNTT